MFGADPFLAVELTVMACLAGGFAGALLLTRLLLGAPMVWAALATVSPSLLCAGIHVQLHTFGRRCWCWRCACRRAVGAGAGYWAALRQPA